MPRIMSRPEMLPQVVPLKRHTVASRSFGRGGNVVSPTISAFPSVTSSMSRCVGISYKIGDRPEVGHHDELESRDEDHDTWGYFVDFTSPQYSAEQRKSATLPLLNRSDAPR
jgi:hypothetical protein